MLDCFNIKFCFHSENVEDYKSIATSLFLSKYTHKSSLCLTTCFLGRRSQSDPLLGRLIKPQAFLNILCVGWSSQRCQRGEVLLSLQSQFKRYLLKEAFTDHPSFLPPSQYYITCSIFFSALSPPHIILVTYYSLFIHIFLYMCTVQFHPLPPKINTQNK